MSINYYKEQKIFKIDTTNSSYVFCVSDFDYIEHLYYGKKIPDVDVRSIANRQVYSFTAWENPERKGFEMSTALLECSSLSAGDVRIPSLVVNFNGNIGSNKFRYVKHEIKDGREDLGELPCSRDSKNCQTLNVYLQNDTRTITLKLNYVTYSDSDVICRHIEVVNNGKDSINLEKVASACLDFYGCDYDLITLEGMYLCERSKVQRTSLRKGIQSNGSLVGSTTHHTNPFFALAEKQASEHMGNVYGFNLVYSGNFKNEIEVDRTCNVRIVSGINETGFNWTLVSGAKFVTPEFIMTYSTDGVGGMSRNMHDHIRNNIIEPNFAFSSRPIVINLWEAYHFDVDEQKILALAENAKKCGIDTLVLDDGWFRNNEKSGLGDFFTDTNKFPRGLKGLSESIHKIGLKMGIWIEPEMVAMESDFLKNNRSGILSFENNPTYSRKQFVIDLTVEENVEYVKNRICEELNEVKIEFIKWDCNRYVNEIVSSSSAQGETMHRQVLGIYKLIADIKKVIPNVFLEMCSGGGGRYDLGMLYYSPQIWASDNTDPFARIYIEYGTSVAYPKSSISCHFSEGCCTSGRTSTYDFRYLVSSFGPFGFELDLTKYQDDDFKQFEKYSNAYKKMEKFVLNGDLYRLISPETDEFCAYVDVTKDKKEALLTFIEINTNGHTESMVVKLKGLDESKYYKNTSTGEIYSGVALMNVGIRIGDLFKERGGSGRQILFIEQQ